MKWTKFTKEIPNQSDIILLKINDDIFVGWLREMNEYYLSKNNTYEIRKYYNFRTVHQNRNDSEYCTHLSIDDKTEWSYPTSVHEKNKRIASNIVLLTD